MSPVIKSVTKHKARARSSAKNICSSRATVNGHCVHIRVVSKMEMALERLDVHLYITLGNLKFILVLHLYDIIKDLDLFTSLLKG